MIPFVRYGRSGGRNPVFEVLGSNTFGSTGSGGASGDYTVATALNLGAESVDRLIICTWGGNRGANTPRLTGLKIGTTSMTLVQNVFNITGVQIAATAIGYLLYPTGLTADVVITLSGDHFNSNHVQLYSLKNYQSATPHDSASDNTAEASPISVTLDTLNGGAVIASHVTRTNDTTSHSWTDLTEASVDTTSNRVVASAYEFPTDKETGRTVEVTDNGSSSTPRCLSVASWR